MSSEKGSEYSQGVENKLFEESVKEPGVFGLHKRRLRYRGHDSTFPMLDRLSQKVEKDFCSAAPGGKAICNRFKNHKRIDYLLLNIGRNWEKEQCGSGDNLTRRGGGCPLTESFQVDSCPAGISCIELRVGLPGLMDLPPFNQNFK